MILIISDHLKPYANGEVMIVSQQTVKDKERLMGSELSNIHILSDNKLSSEDIAFLICRLRKTSGHLKMSI